MNGFVGFLLYTDVEQNVCYVRIHFFVSSGQANKHLWHETVYGSCTHFA
jgi:hypothetical protein